MLSVDGTEDLHLVGRRELSDEKRDLQHPHFHMNDTSNVRQSGSSNISNISNKRLHQLSQAQGQGQQQRKQSHNMNPSLLNTSIGSGASGGIGSIGEANSDANTQPIKSSNSPNNVSAYTHTQTHRRTPSGSSDPSRSNDGAMRDVSVDMTSPSTFDEFDGMAWKHEASNNTSTDITNAPDMFNMSPKLKMNPRDAASPRRSRKQSAKSKSFREYEQSIDGVSSQSQSQSQSQSMSVAGSIGMATTGTGGAGTNASVLSGASSYQSPMGGLAYVETPSTKNSPLPLTSMAMKPPSNKRVQMQQRSSPGRSRKGYTSVSGGGQSVGHHSVDSRSRGGGSINSKGSERVSTTGYSKAQAGGVVRNVPHGSAASTGTGTGTGTGTRSAQQRRIAIGKEEQRMFEQRLCDVNHGVAVRKIHSNGKSQLRYVKCIRIEKKNRWGGSGRRNSRNAKNMNMSMSVPPTPQAAVGNLHDTYSSSKSVSSLRGKTATGRQNTNTILVTNDIDDFKNSMALSWGNKKKVIIPLNKFIAVRKGKKTDRTRKNSSHPTKLLSLMTTDRRNGSLDIEAPTKLDRDKFAKAFSIFLGIPLTGEVDETDIDPSKSVATSSVHSSHLMGDDMSSLDSSSFMTPQGMEYKIGGGALLPCLTPSPSGSSRDDSRLIMDNVDVDLIENHPHADALMDSISSDELLSPLPNEDKKDLNEPKKEEQQTASCEPHGPTQSKPNDDKDTSVKDDKKDEKDDASAVSSLTQGYDQEIVEELHQALNELRAELDASRAEAARAVKVAEQAIQSAESCSSNDWNSTVTHKAAEAAAQAQKRSAEAIAKQRAAESKLASERKSASFWRKQAQTIEDDCGGLQTRLAVAQVQRAAITEELDHEKRKAVTYIQAMKRDYSMSEKIQRETLASTAEQNRLLEIELDGTRRDLMAKAEEVKALQDMIADWNNESSNVNKTPSKKSFFGKSKKQSRGPSLLNDSQMDSTADNEDETRMNIRSLHTEELLKIQAESVAMREQFEMLRRTVADELGQLPEHAKDWAVQASKAVNMAQSEVKMLKDHLSLEMANRRKLLNEVQDLRGTVRVYCRPRPDNGGSNIISAPSHDIGLLHREAVAGLSDKVSNPMCFEFDRMFAANTSHREVYAEMEELVLGTLDGYNACLMAYGQSGSGKTHSMFGNMLISSDDNTEERMESLNCGIHFNALQQLFDVASQRKNRYEDSFMLSILEIHDEKLIDLTAETNMAEVSGYVVQDDGPSKRKSALDDKSDKANTKKLEIRSNHDGDTIVQGQITIPINSYEEAVELWQESLIKRNDRIRASGHDFGSYEASSHLIATIEVTSSNLTTGIGTLGKIRFVDLAASDVTPKRSSSKSKATGFDNILAPIGNKHEWKFVNKSISVLADVIDARINFSRDVPYRNSSLTHVLRDALEADTKTLLLACVRSDSDQLQDTANSLRLASKMRKLVIGKATKRHMMVA